MSIEGVQSTPTYPPILPGGVLYDAKTSTLKLVCACFMLLSMGGVWHHHRINPSFISPSSSSSPSSLSATHWQHRSQRAILPRKLLQRSWRRPRCETLRRDFGRPRYAQHQSVDNRPHSIPLPTPTRDQLCLNEPTIKLNAAAAAAACCVCRWCACA